MAFMNVLSQSVLICFALALPSNRAFADLSAQRSAFLQAEKYLKGKNEVNFLALSASLADYPLYPYLRYLAVKERLPQTEAVLAFLETFKDTRYAPLLRGKWVDYLAEQRRWPEFVRHSVVDDSSADDCRYQWAHYQTGSQLAALTEAKRLWLSGLPAEKYCQPLFAAFEQSTALPPGLIWQRFEAALAGNHAATARSASSLLKGGDRKRAERWLLLHDKPELIDQPGYWRNTSEQDGSLFTHAVKRLKNNDLEKAIRVWEAKSADFRIAPEIHSEVERRLGMALLGKKDSRAYGHLIKVANPDEETRTATVRAALLVQNWQHVETALAGLSVDEKQQPQWQYWTARALLENGKKKQSEAVYGALAEDRSFYGFLAADHIKSTYKIKDKPVRLANDEISALAQLPDFRAAQEFKLLDRDIEVRRQWQFAIKNLPKDKLLAAAKLAEQWGWDQLAITTLVKADYWDDVALRFPLRYLDAVNLNAAKHNLDSALIYGLMRQESMLDKNAESSVGARGLMQLMPETAKKVAKKLNEPWRSTLDLYQPELNIHYGSYYFTDLLSRFGNQVAVACAAYNAGPNRAIKWLPAITPVPADIWIETIPFKETRKYVSSVLSYAMIYQDRIKKKTLRLKDLLGDIRPQKN